MFISFIGRPRAGKDYTMQQKFGALIENGEAVLTRFADPLKELSCALFQYELKDEDAIKEIIVEIPEEQFLTITTKMGELLSNYIRKNMLSFFAMQINGKNLNKGIEIEGYQLKVMDIPVTFNKDGQVQANFGSEFYNHLKRLFRPYSEVQKGEYNLFGKPQVIYHISPRIFQQQIGTNLFRHYLGDFWVQTANIFAEKHLDQDIISPDTRFPNELSMVRFPDHQHKLFYVFRPSRDDMSRLSEGDFKALHPSEVLQEVIRDAIITQYEQDVKAQKSFHFNLSYGMLNVYSDIFAHHGIELTLFKQADMQVLFNKENQA